MIPRADRFQMEIPMRYRAMGRGEWRSGTTANISVSGVLFVADSILERGDEVEMRLVFPGQIGDVPSGRVLCHGQIVRVQPATSVEDRAALAATIANYQLIRANRDAQS